MQHADLYQSLNPHLFIPSRRVPPPSEPVPTKTARRCGIPIVVDGPSIRTALTKVFGFSDQLFADHEYTYPIQTLTGTGDFINVSTKWSTEYYHFLTEALPNALFCASHLPPTVPIVCGPSSFAEGLFRWFGLSNPLAFRTQSGGIGAKYIECGNPSPDTIQLLRDRIESRLSFTQTRGILIRRHGTRVLENEADVLKTFQSLYPDLDWVVFDVLPAEETATLFATAAVIVGPHGAGLTNMLFSARGIRIYEFMPIPAPNLCYAHLSGLLGNSYTMIPTNAQGPQLAMQPSLRHLYLLNNVGQIQLRQPFGKWIETYAADTRFRQYLEIGSWNGRGSTLCLASGFLARTDGPMLTSLEINSDRYHESLAFWDHNPRIHIQHARILPERPDVRQIHSDIEAQWQADDERHFQTAAYLDPATIAPEVVVLDGGEYMTYFEFQALKPYARVFLLDDTLVAKCKRIVAELAADPAWTLVASGTDRNGWAIFQTRQ